MYRQGQAEATADLRNNRHHQQDKVQAAQPFHQAVPQDQRTRYVAGLPDGAGQADRRIGRNTFKKRVGDGQGAGKQIRQHADAAQHNPHENHVPGAAGDAQLLAVPAAEAHHQAAQGQRNRHGRAEIQIRRLPPGKGAQQGNQKGQAVQNCHPSQKEEKQIHVHLNPCL